MSEVMVPQVKDPGAEAEVDFFEATVRMAGAPVTVLFMQMRACYSGRVFVKSLVRPTQQAFFEAMVAGFAWFGAVFHLVAWPGWLTGYGSDPPGVVSGAGWGGLTIAFRSPRTGRRAVS